MNRTRLARWPGIFGAVIAANLLCASVVAAAEKPIVNLNQAQCRDRVHACWLGKTVGGALGMPFAGRRQAQDVTFPARLDPGQANEALDLQMLWLAAMDENNARVDARILGQYWLKSVAFDSNEYGIAKANLGMGLLPPLSGQYNNAQWKHGNGGWVRSEIWACLFPGSPAMAAKMAREDACVDHGAGQGTAAEVFIAAIQSAAFVEHDRDKLIAIGLSMIPPKSELARAVGAAVAAKQAGKDWRSARLDVIDATSDTGWLQAPRNVAFVIIGWLYGDNGFDASLRITINCGDDTGRTSATLGSILGIIHGGSVIPARWSDSIGGKIKTVAIPGHPAPSDIDELTDRVLAMARKVAAEHQLPVAISDKPTDLSKAGQLKLFDPVAARELCDFSPYEVVWTEPGDVQVIVDYRDQPFIQAGKPRSLWVTITNLGQETLSFPLQVVDLPRGWTVANLPDEPGILQPQTLSYVELQINADQVPAGAGRLALEVGGRKSITIPVTLIGKPADVAK